MRGASIAVGADAARARRWLPIDPPAGGCAGTTRRSTRSRGPRRKHAGDAEDAVDRWTSEKPSAVVRRERPEALRQLSRAEWADLDVLTLKAIEPDVARRYRSADALVRDVTAALEE